MEIGGYIELERFRSPMLYEDGIKLNSGRNCLACLIETKGIKQIWMPSFLCASVFDLCGAYGVAVRRYAVDYNFMPVDLDAAPNDYLYLVNYYGQITEEKLRALKLRYRHLIVDNSQAYFSAPVNGVDTLYTCRKFFGVADGAVLFTDKPPAGRIERAESMRYMTHILGRFERTASEFYALSVENNKRLAGQPIQRMSRITENLLHGIDYEAVARRREDNYLFLHHTFGAINKLDLQTPKGPFAYPLMIDEGARVRKALQARKIYVPMLWPNVVSDSETTRTDRDLAENILPLPCDQRYGRDEMAYMAHHIQSLL